jgi:hypothetical protein
MTRKDRERCAEIGAICIGAGIVAVCPGIAFVYGAVALLVALFSKSDDEMPQP